MNQHTLHDLAQRRDVFGQRANFIRMGSQSAHGAILLVVFLWTLHVLNSFRRRAHLLLRRLAGPSCRPARRSARSERRFLTIASQFGRLCFAQGDSLLKRSTSKRPMMNGSTEFSAANTQAVARACPASSVGSNAALLRPTCSTIAPD